MSYRKTTQRGGNLKIVSKSKKRVEKKETKREKRLQKTSEAQRIRNEMLAEKRLLMLLHSNFGNSDYSLALTYDDEHCPDTLDEARNNVANFFRRLRRRYKKFGYELKYIQVTEYKNKRLHHHVILNGANDITVSDIQEIWGNGRIHSNPLEKDGYYKELADYYIKETSKTFNTTERIYGKRWTSSRNLEQPETIEEEITDDSDFYDIPLADGEYILVKESVFIGIDEFTGLPIVIYAMLKPSRKAKKKYSPIIGTENTSKRQQRRQ